MAVKKVYFSPTGTSKKIIDLIGSYFDQVSTSDVTLAKNRISQINLKTEDLLIIGCPVYSGRIPEILVNQLKLIKGDQTPAIIVVVYGNREYDDALLELKNIVMDQGFIPFAAGAFIGEHSFTDSVAINRPDGKDLLVVKEFANGILNKIPSYDLVEVKGNDPYRKGMQENTIGPHILNTCLKCRMCEINCPTGALTYKGRIVVEESLCIRCHACIRKCPVKAIEFDERIDPIKEWLIENHSERKEPELFL